MWPHAYVATRASTCTGLSGHTGVHLHRPIWPHGRPPAHSSSLQLAFHLWCICFCAIPQITRYDYVFPTDLLRLCSWGSIFGAYASALSLRLHAMIACLQLFCFIVAVGSFIFGVYAFPLSLRSHVMSTCSQLSCFVFAVGLSLTH